MAFTFDGPTKTIILSSGTTDISIVDLWSRWCDWLAIGTNSMYLPALRFVGGDAISATKNLGVTFFIINGWRIRPYEGDHRLTVAGNLYTDPAGFSPFTNTLGSFNIVIEMAVSNLSDSTVAQMDQINAAVYRGEVALDVAHGGIGTSFPKGTHQYPSNNVADALTIASYYGIETLQVHGTLTLGAGNDVSGMVLRGENDITTFLTIEPGANVTNCKFENLMLLNSTLDGYAYTKHCSLNNVSGIEGFVELSMLSGALSLTGTHNTYFVSCKSGCVGLGAADLPVLDMSGTNRHVAFRGFEGPIKITNSTDPDNTICIDVSSGATITIDPSCTAGTVYVGGIANIPPTVHGMTVHLDRQLDRASISSAVWANPTEGMYTANEVLRLMASVLTGKVSGAGTGVEVFRDMNDLKNRVSMTVDSSGNRTGVVIDAS